MKAIAWISMLLLVACSSSTPNLADIEKAVAKTIAAQPENQPAILETTPCPVCPIQDTPEPYPTYTSYPPPIIYPTYTPLPPLPTYPPLPTLEPITILVTATAPPDFTQIYQFTGHGKGTTDLFSLQPGLLRVKWEYVGDGNFIFYLKDLATESEKMLENAIGSVSGQSVIKIGTASDRYIFDMMLAQGDWTINVEYKP